MRCASYLIPFAVISSLLPAPAGCGPATADPVGAPAKVAPQPPETPAPAKPALPRLPVEQTTLASVGLDLSAIDKSVDPCSDFYQFACGGWLAKAQIPADKPGWGRTLFAIEKRNDEALRQILEVAALSKTSDAATRKLGDFYTSCMAEPSVEAAGIRPIRSLLDKAKKLNDTKSIGALVSELHKKQYRPLFDISAEQDKRDATRIIAQIDQSGLGLFDRDQYLDEAPKSKELRATYVAHIERMMVLAGLAPAEAKSVAVDVMAIETELAKVSKTRVERRDPQGTYNKLDRAALAKAAPAFPWDAYFKDLGIPDVREVNLTSVKFVEGVSQLLTTVKPEAWRRYFMWTIVRSTAPLFGKKFVDESFRLESALTGQQELAPRWKRCVDATDSALGEMLGEAFVKAHFGAESKTAAEAMVQAISKAFADNVGRLDWMDAATRDRALAKLRAMAYLIGYPDRWKAYDFAVDPKVYAQNAITAREHEQKRKLAKIGKPVDRGEWQMSPPVVNAYYDAQRNHMVFPAGILQPPFYSVKAAVAVNLGGIGMVVGHELTHGFDDEGSQFSATGNLENWWEPAVEKRFKAKTGCVADHYAQFEALPGLKVNGRLTLGENIADMGGMKLAFYAYRAMRSDARTTQVADGFTEDQQFFLANGQVWCTILREELERLIVQTNPHSPPRFRVNGPLRNMPEFAEAFSCAPGSGMRPENTCSVW